MTHEKFLSFFWRVSTTTQNPECLLPRPQKTGNVIALFTDLPTPGWVYLRLVDWVGGVGKEGLLGLGADFLYRRP